MTVQELKDKTKELQTAYDKAVRSDLDKFVYEGDFLVTAYAKYLLEYLNNEIKRFS